MCRWDPPVYPATSSAPPAEQPKKGSKPRIESAFAHSTYPTRLAGWDPAARDDLSANQPSGTSPAHSPPSLNEINPRGPLRRTDHEFWRIKMEDVPCVQKKVDELDPCRNALS